MVRAWGLGVKKVLAEVFDDTTWCTALQMLRARAQAERTVICNITFLPLSFLANPGLTSNPSVWS